MPKKVRFVLQPKIYIIPLEDRRGLWVIDRIRFQKRIADFEVIFLTTKRPR